MSGTLQVGGITLGTHNSGTGEVDLTNFGPLAFSGNRNVYATNNISSAISQTSVKITADSLILFNTSNKAVQVTSVDVTPAITASGANGLDTGTEANSTWYYFYVIYNGTTTAGLISSSNSSPTMPSGYTYKKIIGAIYNYSDGHFVELYQKGGRAYSWYGSSKSNNTIFTASNMAANTQASVNPTAFIPPNADFYTFRVQADTASAATLNIHFNSGVFLRGHATNAAEQIGNSQSYIYTDTNSSTQLGGNHTLPMITPQTFFANAVYTVGTVNLYHVGHEFLGVE